MNQQAPESSRTPVVAVGLMELVAWALGRRIRVRVQGSSMQPLLMGADHVLVHPCKRAEAGDVVLCRHPFQADVRILKRVQDICEDGLFLVGDNPTESSDSSSFGRVPWTHLLGRVQSKF